MKTLLSIVLSIGFGLGIISSVSASDNQEAYGVVEKFGSQVVQKQSLLQKEVLEALVEPYLEQIENRSTREGEQEHLNVWIVADDGKGYKVFFDQNTQKFGLVKYVKGSTPFTSDTLHVRNELTKLFLARI
ncbi:MAG: hypothetical protein KAU29_09175 [Gammaproteobacteria bacterium]|jgi:hypothetical protein|nr:hypothetical protein [Gammaproteobacteria bacterium]